jgi:hypothetical protein
VKLEKEILVIIQFGNCYYSKMVYYNPIWEFGTNLKKMCNRNFFFGKPEGKILLKKAETGGQYKHISYEK